MRAVWKMFWSVCVMRRGPEEVPYSLELLLLVLLLNLLLGLGMQWVSEPVSFGVALALVMLAITLDALVLSALLTFKRRQAFLVQGLTSIYGVDFVLGLLALPFVLAGAALGESPLVMAVLFGQMLLVGWNLGVRGFIYHRTIGIGIFQGNMLSLTLFLLHIFLAARLFPQLLAAPTAQ